MSALVKMEVLYCEECGGTWLLDDPDVVEGDNCLKCVMADTICLCPTPPNECSCRPDLFDPCICGGSNG